MSRGGVHRPGGAEPECVREGVGLYPEEAKTNWSTASIRPFVERAFEVFGADRLMYGGDWPISVLAGDYEAVWQGLSPLFDELPADDRAAVLAGTATRVYRISADRLARLVPGPEPSNSDANRP